MSRIFIDPDTLRQSEKLLQGTKNSLQKSYNALNAVRSYPSTLNNQTYTQLKQSMQRISAIQQRVQTLYTYMEETTSQYSRIDDSIYAGAKQVNLITAKTLAALSLFKKDTANAPPSKWKSYFWKITESEFDHFNLKDGLGKLIKDGASIGGTYGAAIAKASYRDKIASSNVGMDIAAGTFRLSGRCHANWKKDGKFDPNLSASVGAEAALAHGKVFAEYNNDYFGAGVNANGSVGVVSAKAKAIINKDEVTIEGDVGAALAKGECVGKIKLFGMTFTATLSGEVGSIGAGAKYSSTSNSIEFGGKVAFLFGGGFNFKVDY